MKKSIHIIIFVALLPLLFLSCSEEKTTEINDYIIPLDIEWCDVPSGDFTFGPPNNEDNYTTIETIDYDFKIMKYPVTNYQFAEFLNNAFISGDIWVENDQVKGYYPGDDFFTPGVYTLYELGKEFWGNNTGRISFSENGFQINVPTGFKKGEMDNHPVVYVSWYGAYAYANYYGWRIPTEQEWEKAARGITGFHFPWGNSHDSSRANSFNSGDPWDQGTTPVGFYNGQTYLGYQTTDSPSPFGAYDMAGNVWEWTNTWHLDFLPGYRATKGASWQYGSHYLPSWQRSDFHPTSCYSIVGFRCVKDI